MTVLVAPDSFKGTFTAAEVAEAVAGGIEESGSTAIRLPVADGGEGTLDALAGPLGLRIVTAEARNPWGGPRRAGLGRCGDGTAGLEVAAAPGLNPPDRKSTPQKNTQNNEHLVFRVMLVK
ncbi:glycerate kinase, partial [Nocardia sp. NPDC003345]